MKPELMHNKLLDIVLFACLRNNTAFFPTFKVKNGLR